MWQQLYKLFLNYHVSLHKTYFIIFSVVQIRDLRANNFSEVTQPVNERGQKTLHLSYFKVGLTRKTLIISPMFSKSIALWTHRQQEKIFSIPLVVFLQGILTLISS